MFTKEILMDLFKKNEKSNFQIYTNIARGRGINGVEYLSFSGYNYDDDRQKYIASKIKGFADNYLVIQCAKTKGFWYGNAMREVYVPYDAIVMVDFVTDKEHPLYGFAGKHNLKEI